MPQPPRTRKLLYVGHHKCASGYVKRVLTALSDELGLRVSPPGDNWSLASQDEIVNAVDVVIWDNYFDFRMNRRSFAHRGFHVIRDPRDIWISHYHSHRDSHPPEPWLTDERRILRSLSRDEGLRYLVTDSPLLAVTLTQMASWNYDDDAIHETNVERLAVAPLDEWKRICRFLELEISPTALSRIVAANSFAAQRRRDPAHYRDGRVAQWRSAVEPALLELFMERYGELVVRLGYPVR